MNNVHDTSWPRRTSPAVIARLLRFLFRGTFFLSLSRSLFLLPVSAQLVDKLHTQGAQFTQTLCERDKNTSPGVFAFFPPFCWVSLPYSWVSAPSFLCVGRGGGAGSRERGAREATCCGAVLPPGAEMVSPARKTTPLCPRCIKTPVSSLGSIFFLLPLL